jgi:hypothetical protein
MGFADWGPIVATGLVAPSIAGTVAVIIHRQRLDHERGLKLAEVNRDALDDASIAAAHAIRDAPDVVRAAMLGADDAGDQQLAWWNTVAAALTMQVRLHLRLGEDHPACKAYDDTITALMSVGQDVQTLRLEGDRYSEINERGLRGAQECAKAYANFVSEASKVARTVE